MDKAVTSIAELESAIAALSADQYSELRNWFWERDGEKWDRQIEDDAASGKLDFLFQEAHDAKSDGTFA
ncbi:MAG: hypothetical protein QG656_341 [Candidatus Hydrogenedentes bacterium]|nr:hypothetical protein [Candidatus Hydrogenedentota bacterium]